MLSWTARLHAGSRETLAEARTYRDRLRRSGPRIDTRIIDALICEAEGDGESAVRILSNADDTHARSALLSILRRVRGKDTALEWFDGEAGRDDPAFLTGIGWCNLAVCLAEAGRWEEAARRLMAVHDLRVEEWPDLAFVEGVINSALLLPDDLRRFALTMDLFHPAVRTVVGPEVNQRRARADACFARAANLMDGLDLVARAQAARDWRLWLRLTSSEPATVRSAREEVASGMTDGARAITLMPFARGFGIEFDAEPLERHLARRKRLGGLDGRELLAELMLAETTMTPRERVEFLAREEDRLAESVAKETLLSMRIEALVLDRRAEEARLLLEDRKGELTEHDGDRLALMIEAHAGGDPRPGLEDLYGRTGSLIDLHNLVGHLGRAGDWTALRPHLEELFRRERTAENARRLVDCLRHDSAADEADVLAFLEANTDLVDDDSDLISEKAWALSYAGRFEEAQQVNDRLLTERGSERDLALDLNIALQSGDWERFPAIVDREWHRREVHEPRMLLHLASLASQADATADRAFELARVATQKAPSDPHVLVGAYVLATQVGREADADPQWIAQASRMSSERGPAWAIDMRTMVEEIMPAHRERLHKADRLWSRGEIPIHIASEAFNASLSKLLLDLARRNSEQRDGRQKAIIPVISGARGSVDFQEGWTVGLDATSVMVLSQLGLLRKTIATLSGVALAADTMILLLNERRHARFHQPSRLRDAQELRGLIDAGRLRAADPLPTPPGWLLNEVGRDLAEMLEAARTKGGRVVHPFPIHKLRSYLDREAELGEYRNRVLSTVAFARMLREEGYIDGETYVRGESYLRVRDRAEDVNAALDSMPLSQPVYLDGLALTFLQTAGILRPACTANLELRVHSTLRDQQVALIEANREGEALAEDVNRVRLVLREALIGSHAVFVPRHGQGDDERLEPLAATASTLIQFTRDVGPCDAICLDDRWVNANTTLTDRLGKTVPVVCVLDVLRFLRARDAIAEAERLAALHKLRDAGFALIPVDADELEVRLRAAPQGRDQVFRESAELRAIRQNLMRLRSLDVVRLPEEERYLANLSLASVVAVRKLWEDEDLPVDRALACTDWVWRNLAPSPLDWVPRKGDREVQLSPAEAFARYSWLWLAPTPQVRVERHDAYRGWVETVILEPLLAANSDIVDAIAQHVAGEIERVSVDFDGIRATLLAKYCLDCQPESVRRRLMGNRPFGARLGLETRTIVTVADLGRFEREDLLAAARAALSCSGELVVEGLEGISAVIAREHDGLLLKLTGQGEPTVTARLDDLLIVSSSREERSARLASLLHRIGPTAPDFSRLQRSAEKRDLSNEEAATILDELADGVAALHARAARALEAADEAATNDLIPRTMTYYDRFCGPDPGGADAESYLTVTLPACRRRLLARDLVRGLDICLLGALRDDLSPGTWADDVSDDTLWEAITNCDPHSNPHSLLGALDIALGRQHDSRYRSFAEGAVEKLTSTTFPRPDGVDAYELLPLFARIVFARVTMLEGGASRPPYWRRMCAWMQAGWLARMTLPLVLEMPQLREWVAANETPAMTYARMLDLRWEPMSQVAEMSPLSLRCELVGRLHLLRSRHEAAGRSSPRSGEIDAAMEHLGEQGAPFGWALPGPMEGHRQPVRALPADAAEQMIAAFSAGPDTLAWTRPAYFSKLFTLGSDLMQCVRQAAQGIVLDGQEMQREEGFVQLERACSIAAAQRDTQLAHAIGSALLEHTPRTSTGQEAAASLAISILAAAAFEHEAEWAAWLEEQLAATALRLPAGEPIETFGAQLAALKQVLPLRHAIQTRAEALCAAAV